MNLKGVSQVYLPQLSKIFELYREEGKERPKE
jgi:hypothetical protein